MIKKIAYLWLPTLLVLSLFASAARAQMTFPENLRLEYVLTAYGMSLGTMEKRVHSENGEYIADSSIKPGAAAKLFFSGKITESSKFEVADNIMIPLEFHAIREGRKAYDRKATFDHKDNIVRYSDGESEPLRDNTFDLGSFPFAFILEDLDTIDGKIFEINGGKDYDTYQVTDSEPVQVYTPAGEYDSIKITLKRLDKDDRFFFVWLDKNTHYPVKIIREKKGSQSTMELKKISN